MLRIAEHFHDSDLGRQRQGNEDNYYVRSPLFVVADGMGGAQAGEVASEIAVKQFEGGLPDGKDPGEALAALIQAANERIHKQARSDAHHAGMGTTTTAAYLTGDTVVVAHVGDSRCYLLRDDDLIRLTRDHSLVDELIRRGKLTEEQAESHPQRSVITRALGPEPNVEVDVEAFPARAGDVFLLCSDGLTSMVHEAQLKPLLADRSRPLEQIGRELIAAANEAGGRDNITVILFRVEEVDDRRGEDDGGQTAEYDTFAGESLEPRQGVTKPSATIEQEEEYRRHGTVALQALAPGDPRAQEGGTAAPAREPPKRTVPLPDEPPPPRRPKGKRRRRFRSPGAAAAHARRRPAADRRRLAGDPRGLLHRHGPRRRPHRRHLPRAALRAAVGHRALRALLRLGRHARRRPAGAARELHRPQAALARRRRGPRDRAREGGGRVSARNRELLALVPASLLLTAGFAAIFIQQSSELSDVSLTYGAGFLALCLCGHFVIRATLPYADPYLFPLAAVLACFGLVVIYRIDETLAREQAQWFVVGLILFAATIVFLRDFRVLERYRYTVAAAGLLLLLLPRVPVIGQQVNGAYLGVDIGPIAFQPAEFGKIAIVIFLAAYLRDTRQLLVQGSRRVLGVTIPPLKHFGPLLVVWGGAMVMLVFIRDLGSSLMFFGGFLALLYVATNRLSFVTIGLGLFGIGAWFFATTVGHVQSRIDTWRDPFDRELYELPGGSYQIAQSLFAQADGGLFGTGFGQALITQPDGTSILPAPQTDLIYAVITNELGLAGACGLLLVYLMVAERGFKIAMLAQDSFSKLLAAGLTAVFALQVFVIVGGVTKVIPLTGVTLPFVSYGGSSIVANFVLLALLLLVSDRARRPARAR